MLDGLVVALELEFELSRLLESLEPPAAPVSALLAS